MENPNSLAKDAFALIDQAEAIARQAVTECRALNPTESSLVESLRDEAAPMLARAAALREALRAAGVE